MDLSSQAANHKLAQNEQLIKHIALVKTSRALRKYEPVWLHLRYMRKAVLLVTLPIKNLAVADSEQPDSLHELRTMYIKRIVKGVQKEKHLDTQFKQLDPHATINSRWRHLEPAPLSDNPADALPHELEIKFNLW